MALSGPGLRALVTSQSGNKHNTYAEALRPLAFRRVPASLATLLTEETALVYAVARLCAGSFPAVQAVADALQIVIDALQITLDGLQVGRRLL